MSENMAAMAWSSYVTEMELTFTTPKAARQAEELFLSGFMGCLITLETLDKPVNQLVRASLIHDSRVHCLARIIGPADV